MNNKDKKKVDYGNWVSKQLIYVPGFLAIIFLALSIFSYFFLILVLPFMIISAYFAYAYYCFSPAGGDIQAKIREFVLDRLGWDGSGVALDVGCGNGALAIRLAKKFPAAHVVGIDYWGGKWDYSLGACEKNAEIEGVLSRIQFQQASASKLPFEDGYFDAAVSNFVFHEVKDTENKRDVIKEALRTVKKGGYFAFQDLFTLRKIYGDLNSLLTEIRSWGVDEVRYVDTSNADFIPVALKLPFMIGATGIIYGRK